MNAFHAREVWPAGTLVDRKYVVQSTLGRGGFGTVYLARHRVLGHDYVIKRLHSQFAEDTQSIEKFVKEGQAIARLKGCPQIVEVFDMTQTEDGQLILLGTRVAPPHGNFFSDPFTLTIASDRSFRCRKAMDDTHKPDFVVSTEPAIEVDPDTLNILRERISPADQGHLVSAGPSPPTNPGMPDDASRRLNEIFHFEPQAAL